MRLLKSSNKGIWTQKKGDKGPTLTESGVLLGRRIQGDDQISQKSFAKETFYV